ncbi:MAG: hypothetical protein ACE5OW_05215, partial [Candidatus Bathyarchaeia archaeon]
DGKAIKCVPISLGRIVCLRVSGSPSIDDPIVQEFGISSAEAGLLMSAVGVPGIFLAIPVGYSLTDMELGLWALYRRF